MKPGGGSSTSKFRKLSVKNNGDGGVSSEKRVQYDGEGGILSLLDVKTGRDIIVVFLKIVVINVISPPRRII